jgi:hypothetical protein
VLVDVVAEEQHQIGRLLGEMPVGREIAELVIGAGAEAEAKPVERRARRRRGSGVTDRACLAAGDEAVPIVTIWREACAFDMQRMRESGSATASPCCTTRCIAGSSVTSQRTITAAGGMPPGRSESGDNGSGARRVHSTMPSGPGLPEATPKANGYSAAQLGRGNALAANAAVEPANSERRVKVRGESISNVRTSALPDHDTSLANCALRG